MPQSFTTSPQSPLAAPKHRRRSVLVTGAAGNIGSYFAKHSCKRYKLRLLVHGDEDKTAMQALCAWGEKVVGDIRDLEQMTRLFKGIDTVLHLAGDPSPQADWNNALNINIVGTFNVFTAARRAGCRRVVYASSIHAVSGYPADVQVKTSDPVNPGDLYGVSKCFGEALARYMAQQEGLSSIAIRIGAFQSRKIAQQKGGINMLDAWVSQRDLSQLIEQCIDDEKLQFAIFNGLSGNRFNRLDISDARELLGYAPQDDLTEVNPTLKRLGLRKRVQSHNTGDRRKKS
ncbi:MAG TPA: NAD(P)-dependent oxidoreductase [Tepidisphaeraceae bacterium]|jgi:NAD(P)-dependent dehydrogenase (short-subunit alcohol dehydrogenase family)|nr:NAD(P)-dependent oxidoreductase [Tepidisphaeraceae bacterium]